MCCHICSSPAACQAALCTVAMAFTLLLPPQSHLCTAPWSHRPCSGTFPTRPCSVSWCTRTLSDPTHAATRYVLPQILCFRCSPRLDCPPCCPVGTPAFSPRQHAAPPTPWSPRQASMLHSVPADSPGTLSILKVHGTWVWHRASLPETSSFLHLEICSEYLLCARPRSR